MLVGSVVDVDQHDVYEGHPERHARLEAVRCGIRDADPASEVTCPLPSRQAHITDLARVHDELYLDALARLCDAGGGELDPDTVVAPGSWTTAMTAAGLALSAIDELRAGRGSAAFVAPRPPGHHATRTRGMGFCLVNNVAVAAAALAADGERVAVLDWDVHHGNGTQALFWNDPRVLYASIHEWPAYPGTGRPDEVGGPRARGTTVNVPLPAGATGEVALEALDRVIEPCVAAFDPTWILVSAGFDAHRDDPLADLCWSAGDYALLTRRARSWVDPGRLVVVLEGGYDLLALRHSVAATVAALTDSETETEPPTCGGPGRDAVESARLVRTRAGGSL